MNGRPAGSESVEGHGRDVPSAADILGALQAGLEPAPVMMTVTWGPENVLVYQNAESARVLGRRQVGIPVIEAFPDIPAERWDRLADVRATRTPVDVGRTRLDLLDVRGQQLVLRYVMAPLGATSPADGVLITAIDASAEARAEQAADRARLLTGITEQMNLAPEPDDALRTLTDALVPAMADVAAVYVLASSPRAPAGPNVPTALTVSKTLLDTAGPPPQPQARDQESPWMPALASGQTLFIDLAAADGDLEPGPSRDWMRAAGARNLVVVPLLVAGDLTGALVLLATAPREPYQARDTAFFEDVAARAGAAVGHVQRFRQQRETALTLQRALLPATPSPLPGVRVAARYVAGSADVEVGGDWWDVHHLGAGRIGLGVGDVSGRGVPAAALMGQVRAGMRAAAHADLSPVEVLMVLDGQVYDIVESDANLPEHRLPARFATAVYAVLEPSSAALRVASAGHPPLLLRLPDGEVQVVQAPAGPPLGLGVGGYAEVVVPLPAGSLLVGFTDGLVESREMDLDHGIAAAVQVLRASQDRTTVDEIADRLLALADGSDDTALVVVRLDR